MGSWIRDGFLDSRWVTGFIIGLNNSVVYRAQSEVKNKKSMPKYGYHQHHQGWIAARAAHQGTY